MLKRFPQDYSKRELVDLVHHHHTNHTSAASKLAETRDKLITAQKELSRLKRNA